MSEFQIQDEVETQNNASSSSSSVQVVVRIRPLCANVTQRNGDDAKKRGIEIVHDSSQFNDGLLDDEISGTNNMKEHAFPRTVRLLDGVAGHTFTFDEALPESSTQLEIYERRVAPLVSSCLEGYNATVLAYGQTGSGKTHTIMGSSTSPKPASSTSTAKTMLMEDEDSHIDNDVDIDGDGDDDFIHACDISHNADGMIPRAVRSLFDRLETRLRKSKARRLSFDEDDDLDDSIACDTRSESEDEDNEDNDCLLLEYQVRVQLLEIYGEEIRDLLSTPKSISSSNHRHHHRHHHKSRHSNHSKLVIRDVGVEEPEVVGATRVKVVSAEEVMMCVTQGMHRRATAATAMNERSSRSHAILSLIVQQTTRNTHDNEAAPQRTEVKRSKFNFVDLAGSERLKRIQARGQRMKEMIDINQGLLVLGNVIKALGDPAVSRNSCSNKGAGSGNYVPYRHSKLTRLLKGSLGGNHKTLMIVCVSPSLDDMEETLNCLRYANRAKNIKNHAVVNVDTDKSGATPEMVAQLQKQLQAMAADLLRAQQGDNSRLSFSKEYIMRLANGDNKRTPTNASMDTSLSSTVSFLSPASMCSIDEWKDLNQASCSFSDCSSQVSNCTDFQLSEFYAKVEKLQEELRWSKERLNLQMLQQHQDEIDHLQQQVMQHDSASYNGYGDAATATPTNASNVSRRPSLSSVPRNIACYSECASLTDTDVSMSGRGVLGNQMHQHHTARVDSAEVRRAVTPNFDGSNFETQNQVVHHDEAHDKKVLEDLRQKNNLALVQREQALLEEKEELVQKIQKMEDNFNAMEHYYERQIDRLKDSNSDKDAKCSALKKDIRHLDLMHQRAIQDLEQQLHSKDRYIFALREQQREQMEQSLMEHESMQHEVDNLTTFLRKKIAELVSTKQKYTTLNKRYEKERVQSDKTIKQLKNELYQIKEAYHQKLLEEEEQMMDFDVDYDNTVYSDDDYDYGVSSGISSYARDNKVNVDLKAIVDNDDEDDELEDLTPRDYDHSAAKLANDSILLGSPKSEIHSLTPRSELEKENIGDSSSRSSSSSSSSYGSNSSAMKKSLVSADKDECLSRLTSFLRNESGTSNSTNTNDDVSISFQGFLRRNSPKVEPTTPVVAVVKESIAREGDDVASDTSPAVMNTFLPTCYYFNKIHNPSDAQQKLFSHSLRRSSFGSWAPSSTLQLPSLQTISDSDKKSN